MTVSSAGIRTYRYWKPMFPDASDYDDRPIENYSERLRELLYDSVTLRLRADVPVASYLSGGIDSSIISTLVTRHHNNDLITFSVAFQRSTLRCARFQMEMASFLKTDHHMIEATYESIGTPSRSYEIIRKTADAHGSGSVVSPGKAVRSHNIKVVLHGEGADELFGGYHIFKGRKSVASGQRIPSRPCAPVCFNHCIHISAGTRADSDSGSSSSRKT